MSARKARAKHMADLRAADEMFLAVCLEEIDEGQDITIIAEPKAARRLRSILREKRRGNVRVVSGDPAGACASLRRAK